MSILLDSLLPRRNIDLIDLYEVFQTYFPLYLLRNLLHLSYESQYGIREVIEIFVAVQAVILRCSFLCVSIPMYP